eukprot:8368070-Alexandrium_andersonii.AAC.1
MDDSAFAEDDPADPARGGLGAIVRPTSARPGQRGLVLITRRLRSATSESMGGPQRPCAGPD